MKIGKIVGFVLGIILIFKTDLSAQGPLFPNSVVSNDIDFITETDEDIFEEIRFSGLADKEMPSSLSNDLFDKNTFVFEALFEDGHKIEIWCHSSFLTQEKAAEYAGKVGPPLGKLPPIHRDQLDHVVIHNGDATAFAEIEGQFIILYSDNMDKRISTHDLEETVFHETVHGSYQFSYQNDTSWTNAQMADAAYVTTYAQNNPQLEDMAESALFIYTYLKHPGRLSSNIEDWLAVNNPNRIEFFRNLYQITSSYPKELFADFRFILSPNPVDGILSVLIENVSPGMKMEMYTIQGKLVHSSNMQEGRNEIDISDLSSGIYLVRVASRGIKKVVKE